APEPTALHLDFIRASEVEAEARSNDQRKQLEEMAAAQDQRAAALKEAEDALRKRATMARVRNIALVAVGIVALVAGLLGWRFEQQRQAAQHLFAEAERQALEAQTQRELAERRRELAEKQRVIAEEQREQADYLLAGATKIFAKLQNLMDDEIKKEAF